MTVDINIYIQENNKMMCRVRKITTESFGFISELNQIVFEAFSTIQNLEMGERSFFASIMVICV